MCVHSNEEIMEKAVRHGGYWKCPDCESEMDLNKLQLEKLAEDP